MFKDFLITFKIFRIKIDYYYLISFIYALNILIYYLIISLKIIILRLLIKGIK